MKLIAMSIRGRGLPVVGKGEYNEDLTKWQFSEFLYLVSTQVLRGDRIETKFELVEDYFFSLHGLRVCDVDIQAMRELDVLREANIIVSYKSMVDEMRIRRAGLVNA